ncbi:hypothetical protein GEV33_014099 [Tenebrio molitor]|jgi:hypothetical protein|uniref:Uncharacterized protein n=1 Tax=Tenebrio molitor TaxID=7067 RepID=A0A8J6H6D1_TENMO|nr:hypothetical protein GEV33_014099 [Tenebrio molitor]
MVSACSDGRGIAACDGTDHLPINAIISWLDEVDIMPVTYGVFVPGLPKASRQSTPRHAGTPDFSAFEIGERVRGSLTFGFRAAPN